MSGIASESMFSHVFDVATKIEEFPNGTGRCIAAVAGPPGAGKSTLATAVVSELASRGKSAALMPMDGFHLDDRLLDLRGLLPRKGAPETFDFGGLASTLHRLRTESSVVFPVFDRVREIAVGGAAEVTEETSIVVVEGNYLCLDEAPWRSLASFWDISVFLEVSLPELERRLISRWISHGFDVATAESRARENDIENAKRVIEAVLPVDLALPNAGPAFCTT